MECHLRELALWHSELSCGLGYQELQFEAWLLCFLFSSLLMPLQRQQMMVAHVDGPLPPMWEPRMEFLLSLPKPGHSDHLFRE